MPTTFQQKIQENYAEYWEKAGSTTTGYVAKMLQDRQERMKDGSCIPVKIEEDVLTTISPSEPEFTSDLLEQLEETAAQKEIKKNLEHLNQRARKETVKRKIPNSHARSRDELFKRTSSSKEDNFDDRVQQWIDAKLDSAANAAVNAARALATLAQRAANHALKNHSTIQLSTQFRKISG